MQRGFHWHRRGFRLQMQLCAGTAASRCRYLCRFLPRWKARHMTAVSTCGAAPVRHASAGVRTGTLRVAGRDEYEFLHLRLPPRKQLKL